MTPKEKARELFDKFLGQCASDNGEHALILTKQCALICVDEIFEFMKSDDIYHGDCHMANSHHVVYWSNVKTEIENL